MIFKVAFDLKELGEFLNTTAGKRTAIGAAIGAGAGAVSKKPGYRTNGAIQGGLIGGAAGFAGHHTGAIDTLKTHLNTAVEKTKTFLSEGKGE